MTLRVIIEDVRNVCGDKLIVFSQGHLHGGSLLL